jgi:hypothetical protein
VSRAQPEDDSAQPVPFLEQWNELWRRQLVSFDPDILVLQRISRTDDGFGWGTVFYSAAREDYKRRVGEVRKGQQASFDLDLMRRVSIGRHGGLVIAANPNSMFEGHLVIYPEQKREDLSSEDLRDMCTLAPRHPLFSFIHNMERAAASIVDWAHFQAYPVEFPLSREPGQEALTSGAVVLSRVRPDYPAFVIVAEAFPRLLARFLFDLLVSLRSGEAPGRQRVPCNIIWQGRRAWVVPRSAAQSEHAAQFIGALEMGGLFCLPTADSLPTYLPGALREEVRRASLHDEPELRRWFEDKATAIASALR